MVKNGDDDDDDRDHDDDLDVNDGFTQRSITRLIDRS
jgi:hypothetical protein